MPPSRCAPAALAVLGVLILLLGAASVPAIPTVRKTAGGLHVVAGPGGTYSVPAGQSIDWEVTICNDEPANFFADFSDYLHVGECLGQEWLRVECPLVQDAGGTVAACDDVAVPSIDVRSARIGTNGCTPFVFRTTVDLLTPVGTSVCNIGLYQTTATGPNASGQTSPPSGTGCTCVTVTEPSRTAMILTLRATPEVVPVSEGDAASTVLLHVEGSNQTPRPVSGRLLVPIPSGLAFVGTVECPPGATCMLNGSRFEATGVTVPEGGVLSATIRVRPTCASVGLMTACTQATFEPVEDPTQAIASDDPDVADIQATCVRFHRADPYLTKTWRLVADRDSSGGPTPGDRVRFLITAWNRGQGTSRAVVVTDVLPLGFDGMNVTTDALGTYDMAMRTATWRIPELASGAVASLWLEVDIADVVRNSNRARLTTSVIAGCSLATILSDDPLTFGAPDPTPVPATGTPIVLVRKDAWWNDANGDGRIGNGESVAFTLVVRNVGTATATAVRVQDDLAACWAAASPLSIQPAGAARDLSAGASLLATDVGGIDGLAPDEEVRITFTTSSSSAATCCNQARATWGGGGTGSSMSDDPRTAALNDATCLQPVSPSLSLRKEAILLDDDGDSLQEPGEAVQYVLTLVNTGGRVTDAVVADEIPVGTTLVLDSASIDVTGAVPVTEPPPAGILGNGRVAFRSITLESGTRATMRFKIAGPAALGTTCNRATLLAPAFTAAVESQDVVTGGETCFTLVPGPAPAETTLAATLTGELATGCALVGEDGIVVIDYEVLPGTDARNARLLLQLGPGVSVADPDGGVPDPFGVSWALGTIPAGTTGRRQPRILVDCAAQLSFDVFVTLTAANAANAAVQFNVPLDAPDVAITHAQVHDDSDADGLLDPGEELRVELTVTALAGCDAGTIEVALDLDPALLDVVALENGGADGGARLTWSVPLGAGETSVVAARLTLDPAAADCAEPTTTGIATWQVAPGLCRESTSLGTGPVDAPPAPCTVTASHLLREDAVTTLGPPPEPLLETLLDERGDPASCMGLPTRIDPSRVFAMDVGPLLDPGVVVPNDASFVGDGTRGVLVFYEVAASCDTIHACKVDGDGDPGNGRESVRIGVRPCS